MKNHPDDYLLHTPYLVERGPLQQVQGYPGEEPKAVENQSWRGLVVELAAIAWPFAVADIYAPEHKHAHRIHVDLTKIGLRPCPEEYAKVLKGISKPGHDPLRGLGKRAP